MSHSPYITDLLAQPKALQDTLDGLAAAPPLGGLAQRLAAGEFKRIILTGMGSSFHALHPLALRLAERGFPAHMVETSELVHDYAPLLRLGTLVVAVSQSGRSAETLRLLELCRGRPLVGDSNTSDPIHPHLSVANRLPLVGVTNTPDSPLAREADWLTLTRAGEEASVSCKTYLATLAGLAWLGEQITPGLEVDQVKSLSFVPGAVAQYLEGLQEHVSELFESMKGVRHLFLVGRGASLAAVGQGALIIKESARFPCEGLGSAAFRHGPFEMVSPETMVVVLRGAGPGAELNARLAQDVQAAGGRSLLIERGEGRLACKLPLVPGAALPLLEILPLEMLSLALARINGIEPGVFRLGSKVTERE